jgi:DNA-binding response OmpR family regulator
MARILSIDDDESIRRLLSIALSDRGHVVLEAGDGEEGLRLAHAEHPELILLDIGLPGLHGTSVLEQLKHDPSVADIPVIVVSAWGEEVTARTAIARGAVDVIRKPFELVDLLHRAENALVSS